MKEMASTSPTGKMNKIERAHQMYREGKYDDALGFYTEALSTAKTKPQKIALHSNRAACYLKLKDFKKAARECSWVLELDQNHSGALMLRAQTLVTLKEYHSALFDVKRLIELNPASEVYRNLEARLKTRFFGFAQGKSLAPIPEAEIEFEEDDEELEKEHPEVKNEAVPREEDEDGVKNASELEDDNADTQNEIERYKGNARGKCIANELLPKLQKAELESVIFKAEVTTTLPQNIEKSSDMKPLGWQNIAKPKGHSRLDYSRWDRVEDDSSEDEEDDDDCLPQYRFRVKTVGVHAVK